MAGQLSRNLALLPAVRRELAAVVARDRPRLMIADFTATVAGQVAEAAGMPWVTLMPTPLALETRSGAPGYCGGWGPAHHLGHRARDACGRAATRALKAAFGVIFARKLRALSARIYRPDGSEASYSNQAILGLEMSEVEFPRDWPECFELIGPVTETP